MLGDTSLIIIMAIIYKLAPNLFEFKYKMVSYIN